jgi:uncharacterized membrane protein YeaQ/YmgE (transglycosylase-associated protein family)
MGVLSWILFGLLAGAAARLIVPGRQSIGCLATLVIGVIGAFIGGLIGQVLFGHKVHFGWDLGPFLLAVAGAVLLLLALDAIAGRRRRLL